jgi:hypothetical protein
MWVAQEEHGKIISLKREHMKCLKHATYRDGHRAFKIEYDVFSPFKDEGQTALFKEPVSTAQ